MKRQIGDTRTFERYLGEWKIIDIIENKNIQLDLTLGTIKCPHCGGIIGEEKRYIFNYIEILQEGHRKLHLGISEDNRVIVLEEYLGFGNVKKIIQNA